MEKEGYFSTLLDDSNNNNEFQTAMYTMDLGRQVEAAVKSGIQTFTPALVEESVKRELQTLITPLVEEAVLKGIRAAIPTMVEEVLHRGMQTLMPKMVEEMRKIISTSPPLLQSSDQLPNSRQLLEREDLHASRTLQLHFHCQSQRPFRKIFTHKSLQEQEISLKIVLKDDSGNIVEVGAESSMKVKIVVLDGDFSGEDDASGNRFNEHVLKQREHKPPLLARKHEIALSKGVADVGDVMFTDNSSWVRSRTFRLGAKVAKSVSSGVVVKEAVSEAFEVKERRGESYQKKGSPALNDEVWRLHKIARNGNIHTRLKRAGINSVSDLLQKHSENEESLKKIVQVSDQKYKDIIKQARSAYSCSNRPGYYIDANEGKDAVPRAYGFLNEPSNICSLHSPLLSDDNLLATDSSANILPNITAAKPGDSEMQQRMVSQPQDPLNMYPDSSFEHLELTPDIMNRFQEIENDLRACVRIAQPSKRGSNKPRWRCVGAALRFSVFSYVINRQARRAQKKQKYH